MPKEIEGYKMFINCKYPYFKYLNCFLIDLKFTVIAIKMPNRLYCGNSQDAFKSYIELQRDKNNEDDHDKG